MLQKDADLANPATILDGFARPAALLALLSATCYGLGQLLSRSLSRHVPPVVSSFYQNFIYLGVSLALAAYFDFVPSDIGTDKSFAFLSRPWLMPPSADLPLLLGIAVLGSLAMPLFSHRLQVWRGELRRTLRILGDVLGRALRRAAVFATCRALPPGSARPSSSAPVS